MSTFPCTGFHSGKHCSICWNQICAGVVSAYLGTGKEPDLVHNLFFKGAADWQNALNSWRPKVSYGAVFTHQKPLVTFTSSTSKTLTCELADLLIVITNHSSATRRAILFQAKMARGSWPPANKSQWELLTTWPKFQYIPHGTSAPVTRMLPFLGRHDAGAQYMIMDTRTKTILGNAAVNPKPHSIPFSDFIYDFLNASTGRDISWSQSSAKDDWDELIWDLISSMKKAVATIGGAPNQARNVGTFFQLFSGAGGDDDRLPFQQ